MIILGPKTRFSRRASIHPLVSFTDVFRWVMIYWVAGFYGSANLYKAYQKEREVLTGRYSKVPLGVSLFEGDLYQLPDDFASMIQPVVFFKRHAKGGHFPGFEQ